MATLNFCEHIDANLLVQTTKIRLEWKLKMLDLALSLNTFVSLCICAKVVQNMAILSANSEIFLLINVSC